MKEAEQVKRLIEKTRGLRREFLSYVLDFQKVIPVLDESLKRKLEELEASYKPQDPGPIIDDELAENPRASICAVSRRLGPGYTNRAVLKRLINQRGWEQVNGRWERKAPVKTGRLEAQ